MQLVEIVWEVLGEAGIVASSRMGSWTGGMYETPSPPPQSLACARRFVSAVKVVNVNGVSKLEAANLPHPTRTAMSHRVSWRA